MKMYTLLALSLISFIHAAQPPSQKAEYTGKQINGTCIIYEGITARQPAPYQGKLTCKVSYDSENNSYTGEVFNHGYSRCDWLSMPLPIDKAQQYYLELAQQDPNH